MVHISLEPMSQKMKEVTSSALVGLNTFLSSSNLSKGLLLNFDWHDGLPVSYFWVLYENPLTIENETYIVFLLTVLFYYLKHGIFMHIKCF